MNLRALSLVLGYLATAGCSKSEQCTAGDTQCVNSTLMRTCAPDGLSWVPSACAANETCDPAGKACARATRVACSPSDSACVGGVPFVCNRDGTGFDTTACPANTHCVGAGRCQGNGPTGCLVGTSCNADTVVSCSDGKSATYTQCAVGHACLVDPATRAAACKAIACSANARQCGNATDPAADRGTFVSTCKADGSGWAVAPCEAGSLCSAGTCQFDCLPGKTTCSYNSIVTCNATGKWDLASVNPCGNGSWCFPVDGVPVCGDPLCAMTNNEGYCSDANHHSGCSGGISAPAVPCAGGCQQIDCRSNQDCPTGLRCSNLLAQCAAVRADGSEPMSGAFVCMSGCVDGETRCSGTGVGAGVETCAGGRWPGAATACNDASGGPNPTICIPLSVKVGAHKAVCAEPLCSSVRLVCTPSRQVQYCVDGRLGAAQDCPAGTQCTDTILGCVPPTCQAGETICDDSHSFVTCDQGLWSDTFKTCGVSSQTGALLLCQNQTDPATLQRSTTCRDCTPGQHRCSLDRLGTQTCRADGTWDTAVVKCAFGACNAVDGSCTTQCKPGETLCGGLATTVNGQTAWSASGKCTSTGLQPGIWSACSAGTYCRSDQTGAVVGCVECVGSRVDTGFVDSKCSADARSVVFCGDNDTWDLATTQSCGNLSCAAASRYTPAQCVGN
jgi:hypothetical protein